MRVIVTGSRKWENRKAVYNALNAVYEEHGPFMVVHGGCSTGADRMADDWADLAFLVGIKKEVFKAAWEARGKQAGPERNERMIEAGADLVLAFPLPEGSGTQHTMRLAREVGIPVQEYKP